MPGGASGAKVIPGEPAAKPSAPVPPKVKKKVEPTYPPEKLAKGEKAVVKVTLSIDATGKVVNAKVLESGGPEFDAAALEAAAKLEFEPASVDGKPIPAKIPYRFTFDFQDVPKPPPPGETEKPAEKIAGLRRNGAHAGRGSAPRRDGHHRRSDGETRRH